LFPGTPIAPVSALVVVVVVVVAVVVVVVVPEHLLHQCQLQCTLDGKV
jgi:hypothetical protein